MNVVLLVLSLMIATSQPTQAIRWASPAQGEAFTYGPQPACASGGWGSGKTWAYCLKALWLSDTFEKNRGLIFRAVGKELRATTMATFFKLCPPSAYNRGKRNDMEGLLRLNNGSEILFMHMESPDIQGVVRGLEINWFFGDQAEEKPDVMEEIFDMLLGRLSRWDPAEVPDWMVRQELAAGRDWPWKNPGTGKLMPPPYAMMACNPDTELHWLYRRFHPESPEHRNIYKARGYKLFEIHSLDNQFLPDSNKQALLDHDDAFVQRNVYGRWGYAEGTIHAIPAESLIEGSYELLEYFRRTCTLHRFMDHGESSPTCCLWMAVDREDNVFWMREYYMPNQLISTHRANITALSEGERYSFNLADPSIFHKTSQKFGGRWAVADEYSDSRETPASTALFWSPADNNELGTRNRINEYLKVDASRIHPITHTRGAPRMFFVKQSAEYPNGCFHCISQTRAQRRVKIGTDNGKGVYSDERDETITDHAYDPVRYGTASRPPIARVAGPAATPGTFRGEQQRAIQRYKPKAGRL